VRYSPHTLVFCLYTTEALWSQTEFIEKIGINFSEAGLASKMKPLIGNRILYPDGNVNSFVQRYLQQQILKLFEAKPKRPAQKAK
jgi:hypothetical protein